MSSDKQLLREKSNNYQYDKKKILTSGHYSDTTSTESDGLTITVSQLKEDIDQLSDNERINLNYLAASGFESTNTTDYTSESGCENESIENVSPELRKQIVECLEEYFNDECLSKDLFLLKHVKRRKDGFVSLKLMAGYKKMKKLTKSWKIVAMAAKSSDFLEVDETGRKVRRRHPLPEMLMIDVPSSRTILAVDLTPELTSMESLAASFASYGTIASLQVVRPRPGGGVPPALQTSIERLPQISKNPSAIIEYEDVWGAGQALREFKHETTTLHILKLPQKRRTPNTSAMNTPRTPRTPRSPRSIEASRLLEKSQKTKDCFELSLNDSSCSEDDSSNSRSGSRLSFIRNEKCQISPRSPRNFVSQSNPTTPRTKLEKHNQFKGTLRSPRGPDGTKGFSLCRENKD